MDLTSEMPSGGDDLGRALKIGSHDARVKELRSGAEWETEKSFSRALRKRCLDG
jgi:hypothetical protein